MNTPKLNQFQNSKLHGIVLIVGKEEGMKLALNWILQRIATQKSSLIAIDNDIYSDFANQVKTQDIVYNIWNVAFPAFSSEAMNYIEKQQDAIVLVNNPISEEAKQFMTQNNALFLCLIPFLDIEKEEWQVISHVAITVTGDYKKILESGFLFPLLEKENQEELINALVEKTLNQKHPVTKVPIFIVFSFLNGEIHPTFEFYNPPETYKFKYV